MKLHKEGYTPIALAILFIFVLNALIQFYHPTAHTLKWTVYILSGAFFLVMLLFFRSPFVDIATDETAVLSPADGKIISISEVDEAEFLKDRRVQLSLTMSPIKVHVSRNPIAGVVSYFKYHKGQPKSATDYERTTICVQNSEGVSVLLRQIAGAFARRIVWYVKEGDIVDQGQQFGFVKFGSRIDVIIPLGSNILVTVGDC
jgi:phosphatidylserine decarboxylase